MIGYFILHMGSFILAMWIWNRAVKKRLLKDLQTALARHIERANNYEKNTPSYMHDIYDAALIYSLVARVDEVEAYNIIDREYVDFRNKIDAFVDDKNE